MMARRTIFSTLTGYCVVAFAAVVLGLAGGCGSEPSAQATLDEAAQARVKEQQDRMKAFMAKKPQAAKQAGKRLGGPP